MLHGIFDTHAHYDDARFAELLDEVLECQLAGGVSYIINCGSDEASSEHSIALAEKYDFIYAAVGVHPEQAGSVQDGWLARIESLASHPKCVAIGEIGLDYHYPEPSRELQKAAFRAQVLLANRLKLPIEVHDRDAHGDVFAIISELRPHGCLHRYSGSPEQAHEYAKLGMHLGIGGALTYHNSKKEIATVEQLPLESLLLETDCPYLAPAQRRGTTSTSEMISIVAERISEIKGNVTPQQIIDITTANAKALFRIK